MTTRIPVILDTDIGDDIDDAIALGLILACPELELRGVTTVFGNVTARARQARTVLAVAGASAVPVAAGCGGAMTTRPPLPHGGGTKAYLAGEVPNQDASCWPEERLPALDRRHGVDLLIELIMAGAGDIVPITIGAMTNLAMALVKEPRIAAKIPRIVAMAAEVRTQHAEWNIRCDPEAAAIVMRSGIRIEVTPWWIGYCTTFAPEHVERLRDGGPLARHLARTVDEWKKGWGRAPRLYDPLAVATMIRPEFCEWRTGRLDVELQGSGTWAYTPFTEDAAGASPGPHRLAWDVSAASAVDFVLGRILAHGGAASAAGR